LSTLMCEALKELRGYGESLVLASQSPSELASTVLRTCGAVLSFALQEGEDRERVREALGLLQAQAASLSSLVPGAASASLQGRTPYEVRLPLHPMFP